MTREDALDEWENMTTGEMLAEVADLLRWSKSEAERMDHFLAWCEREDLMESDAAERCTRHRSTSFRDYLNDLGREEWVERRSAKQDDWVDTFDHWER